MSDLTNPLRNNFDQFTFSSALDVVIISLIIFWLFMLIRGTTAMAVMRGAVILLLAAIILARTFNLRVLNFLLENSFTGVLIALPIIFQPEIRRALERIGRTGARAFGASTSNPGTIEAVAGAASGMSRQHVGALMVIERETGLQDYIESGIPIDAVPSPELLHGIFFPNSPLHDGAIVLRGNRVVAASVTLPLSDNTPPGELGTRHRAALGITERTDAVSVVVSEETGDMSVAADGRLYTRLDEARLRALLDRLLSNGRVREG